MSAKKKAVVLLSGGLDSSTLLYLLIEQDYACTGLFISYGQRHRVREMLAADAIAEKANIPIHNISLSGLDVFMQGRPLMDKNADMPHGHYTAENMRSTVVPNRNAMFLSIAYAAAAGIEADAVAYAAHAGDHAIYPDCRIEFVNTFNAMEVKSLGHEVDNPVVVPLLITPFLYRSKAEIVKLGHRFGVPFGLTYSCYEGGVEHCGQCGTCVERKEAFQLAEIRDPTIYRELPWQ